MSKNVSPDPSQAPTWTSPLDRIPVFYTPLMVAETDSFSPSAAKPKAAVASWLKLGIALSCTRPVPIRISKTHLGGWLTTQQLHKRDRLVFETAAELRIPVAWNLAGGYQTPLRKVLKIHDNTMQACAGVHL